MPKNKTISEKLSVLPHSPGVYLMKNAAGSIIYVGKSKCLKNRVSSYFQAPERLNVKTRKLVGNIADFETIVTGSVTQLCASASETARRLGYRPVVLTASLCCEAKEAGSFLASIAQYHRGSGEPLAFIAGGETVVRITGKGSGGRNQELALAAAPGIAGLDGCAVFSVGSDGTDGPTDAAGGFVDSTTQAALKAQGCDIFATLADNDAYHALQKCNGLIITGPTGTNVNDVALVLING